MHLILRLGLFFSNFFHLILHRILSWIYRKKPATIPPIKDPLLTQSITVLARRIRYGEITSYEVVSAFIERIEEVNPILNAVVDNRFDDALNEAMLCDEQLKAGKFGVETLEKEKPLFGVPFTVKECCPVKGLNYSAGSLARKGVKATTDGIVVRLIRDAGGIPLCVTNLPEMCSGFNTTNFLYGRTYNPYDTRYTPGGSSGGEGALLGSGASLFGIGSDIAGSIRVPALFCGVFGHKPTSGIVPTQDHVPWCDDEDWRKYLTFGPLVRYAEDLSLVMRVMTSRCGHNLRLDEPVDLKRLKIYYRQSLDDSFGVLSVTPEMKECVSRAAGYFGQLGLHAEKLPIEWPVQIVEIIVASFLDMKILPHLLIDINDSKVMKNPIVEFAKSLFRRSQHTMDLILFAILVEFRYPFSREQVSHYVQMGRSLRQKLLDLLGEDGVFIYPTARITTSFPDLFMCELTHSVIYSALANILGFPSVHVPMGLNSKGLPVGVQVIAGPYQDRLCLAVAKELETAFGGWVPARD